MQRRRTSWSTKVVDSESAGPRALITLKIVALLVGYAIFVWIAMTQLDRHYPALPKTSVDPQIGSSTHSEPLTESVEPRSRSARSLPKVPEVAR
jgi:hypothetical protein